MSQKELRGLENFARENGYNEQQIYIYIYLKEVLDKSKKYE